MKKDRFYLSNGKQVPSGTTVLPRPYLADWAAGCAVSYLESSQPSFSGFNKLRQEEWFHAGIFGCECTKARTAHNQASMEAADYGTYIHTLCEYSLKHDTQIESPDEMTNKFMQGFWDWKVKHNVKVIAMEHEVLSEWYGGRLDLVCEMDSFWMTKVWCKRYLHTWREGIEKQRVVVLVDFKTGKGSYYENWKYQLAGYREAWNKGQCVKTSCIDFDTDKCCSCMQTKEIQHQGILKFNKDTMKVNYKDFTEYEATRTKVDGKFIDGKLETEKYSRNHQIDYQTFYGFVRSWWNQNRGISI